MLTRDQLEALEAQWRAQGALIVDGLQPGLRDEEMDELTAPLGRTLPTEARTWWGWHDGTASTCGPQALGLDLLYLPLAGALNMYREQLPRSGVRR
jgi:hypothetical protein